MSIVNLLSLLALLVTAISLWLRHLVWVRRLAVAYLALVVGFCGLGATSIARFGMIDDLELLRSQVSYADAYRAGLLAAQDQALRFVPGWLFTSLCLAVLAWFPVTRAKGRGEAKI
jgi:hypothetical protein